MAYQGQYSRGRGRPWVGQADGGHRRRSPPRAGDPDGYPGGSQAPYSSQRSFAPHSAPSHGDYRDSRGPHAPPAPYRQDYGSHAPGGPPRNAVNQYPPKQSRYDGSSEPPYRGGYDQDGREPPAKRFSPANYEPARGPADGYRSYNDAHNERAPYRAPERPAYQHPPADMAQRRPPYPSSDRYGPPAGSDLPPRGMADGPPNRARPYEPPFNGQGGMTMDPGRARALSQQDSWQDRRLPPSPRSMGHPPPHAARQMPPSLDDRPYARAPLPPGRFERFEHPPAPAQYHDSRPPLPAQPAVPYQPYAPPEPFDDQSSWNRGDRADPVDVDGEPVPTVKPTLEQPIELGSSPPLVVAPEAAIKVEPEPERAPSPEPPASRSPPPAAAAVAEEIPASPAAEEEGSRQPTPSPVRSATPPFVQQDFSDVLLSVMQGATHAEAVVASLQGDHLDSKDGEPSRSAIRDITNLDSHAADIELHEHVRDQLEASFRARAVGDAEHIDRLYAEYRERNDQWRKHCERLDEQAAKEKEAIAAAQAAQLPLNTPTLPPLSARTSRRGGAGFFGDAVRSEAEFQELLASLEAEEMADPNLRATRTAAIVPDLLLPSDPERRLAMLDVDSTLVVDPVAFFQVEPGRQVEEWTQEEQSIFCKRFALYPKAFGKIAAGLPGRSTADCVKFYYHNKYRINFRSLLDKRRNRGLRRGGASSLLSNLQSSKTVETADDEPAAEQNGSPNLDYAASIPIKERHGRPAGPKQTTSRRGPARFALPLANVMPEQAPGLPLPATDGASQNPLLPPVSIKGQGPAAGFFTTAERKLQQPSPTRQKDSAALGALLNGASGRKAAQTVDQDATDDDEQT